MKKLKNKVLMPVYMAALLMAASAVNGCGAGQSASVIHKDVLKNGDRNTGAQKISEKLVWDHCMELDYADRFSVDYYLGGYALVTIADSECYLVIPEGAEIPGDLDANITVLQQPMDHVYLVASAVMDMFVSMDSLDYIRFSGLRTEAWYIPEATEAMENGDIHYAGKYSAPDYENLLLEQCDLAIENTMIYHSPDVIEKLEKIGIPVLVDRSSLEQHPLGRTEWVKLYGVLAGHEEQALAAFEGQKKIFEDVTAETQSTESWQIKQEVPTVAYFYLTSNGAVNVRKSSDYLPKMIALAGGRYIFDDLGETEDTASSTMIMQLEEFYAAAKDADYMIYNSTIEGELSSLDDLIGKNVLMQNFKAVQSGNVYGTSKNLYQSSMELGTIIADIHNMLTGETNDLVYLYKFEK